MFCEQSNDRGVRWSEMKPRFDIAIYDGDMVHCVDVLDALTKNTLGTAAADDDLGHLLMVTGRRRSRRVAGTTLERRRQQYSARLIQAAWRRHVQCRRDGRATCSVHDDYDAFTAAELN